MAGFVCFLIWEAQLEAQPVRRVVRDSAVLVASALVSFAVVITPFIALAGFDQVWYCTVAFVAKYYRADPANNLGVFWTSLADTRPEQVEQVIAALHRTNDPPIIWYDRFLPPGQGDHLQPLREYMKHYRKIVDLPTAASVWTSRSPWCSQTRNR